MGLRWALPIAARASKKLSARLSDLADEMASASAETADKAAATLDDSNKFKLSMIGDAKSAMDASLDAGKVLADAVEAGEEAERLEALAEAALVEMEGLLEQHLKDFPDSDLAGEL